MSSSEQEDKHDGAGKVEEKEAHRDRWKIVRIIYAIYIKPASLLTKLFELLLRALEIVLRGISKLVTAIFVGVAKAVARETPYLRVFMFIWEFIIASALWIALVRTLWPQVRALLN